MRKYFIPTAFIIILCQFSCQQRSTVRAPEKRPAATVDTAGGWQSRYYDSIYNTRVKNLDSISPLLKTNYRPTFLRSVHLGEENVGTLSAFDSCGITFFDLFRMGGNIYEFIPVAQLPRQCRELVSDVQYAEGSKIYAGNTLIRINSHDLVNGADHHWEDGEPMHIIAPEMVARVKGKKGELFYFVTSTAWGKKWFIGFIFRSGKKYTMKSFMADVFDDRWIGAGSKKDEVRLFVGRSIHSSYDSIAFTRFDISMDGLIRREKEDSLFVP